MEETFPQTSHVTAPISNLFEEYILLFDEPEKANLSKVKAADNKVDNLKKIINEDAKAMESEPQGPNEPQGPSKPPNDRTTFEGESSSTPKRPDFPFQGENPSPTKNHASPIEGENSESNVEIVSSFEGENNNTNEEYTQSEFEEEINVELNPAYDPNYPPLLKWTRDHPKTQVIGESSEGVLTRS